MPRQPDLNNPFTTMMPVLFSKETDSAEQCRLLHLIVVEDPRALADTLYLVDSNYDITYAGQVYQRIPLSFSGVSVSSDGSIDKASITVANVARTIMPLLEEHDGLSGFLVSVITVYEKFLDFTYTLAADGAVTAVVNAGKDTTAHIRDEFYIDSYSANEQAITFQLNAVVDFDVKVPRRRFTPFSCYARFRDPESCGYPATCIPTVAIPVPDTTLTFCDKSLDACINRCNSARFGGFPGVPTDTRRLHL